METTQERKTMEAKPMHTPGKWKMGKSRNGCIRILQDNGVCDSKEFVIASLQGSNPIANARLIASAPALAEACRVLVEIETQADGGCSYCACTAKSAGGCGPHCPVALARAALREAGL